MRRTRIRSLLALLALVSLTGACGSGAVQLSRSEYERLPRDYRQEVFDAENDLVIARNRKDEATDRKLSAEQTVERLKTRWKRTREALNAAGQAAKVEKAVRVFEMNVAYASSLIDVAGASIRRAEAETRLSRARLDLVRQRQLARIGQATVSSLKPFEETVKDLEVKLKAETNLEVDLRTRVQTQLTAWKSAEDTFVSGTGDYDTFVWGE